VLVGSAGWRLRHLAMRIPVVMCCCILLTVLQGTVGLCLFKCVIGGVVRCGFTQQRIGWYVVAKMGYGEVQFWRETADTLSVPGGFL
jgi:hypothetical protein